MLVLGIVTVVSIFEAYHLSFDEVLAWIIVYRLLVC